MAAVVPPTSLTASAPLEYTVSGIRPCFKHQAEPPQPPGQSFSRSWANTCISRTLAPRPRAPGHTTPSLLRGQMGGTQHARALSETCTLVGARHNLARHKLRLAPRRIVAHRALQTSVHPKLGRRQQAAPARRVRDFQLGREHGAQRLVPWGAAVVPPRVRAVVARLEPRVLLRQTLRSQPHKVSDGFRSGYRL